MVLNEQPVAHVLTLAIDGERLAVADIVDEQRNQLLRELIGSVVVRTIGHDDRHAVGIVVGTHEVVRRSLGGTVRRMRIVLRGLQEELVTICQVMLSTRSGRSERWFNALRMRQLQCAIHLVSRDMVEALALVTLRQCLPIEFGSLQKAQRTHHVGLGKGKRVLDGAVHMALSSEVDDAVDLLVLHQLVESIEIADVHLHKLVVRLVLYIL